MGDVRSAKEVVISGADISVIVHATEDERKVERAIMSLVPEEAGGVKTMVQRMSGHHSSPIIHMTMRITRRRAALETLRNLIRSLSPLDRRRLVDDVDERVDDAGNLYVRLDKQSAYLGRAMLHEADSVRMKFRFRVPHGTDSVGFVRACLAEYIEEVEQDMGILEM